MPESRPETDGRPPGNSTPAKSLSASRDMNFAAVPATLGAADSGRSLELPDAVAYASPVALPATRLPVDARGLGLVILAVLASVFAQSRALGFVVPLLLGIVMACTLSPRVAWLEAIRVPRVVGTVIVMASAIGALVIGAHSLRGQMQTMQIAATEVEGATAQAAARAVN